MENSEATLYLFTARSKIESAILALGTSYRLTSSRTTQMMIHKLQEQLANISKEISNLIQEGKDDQKR